MGQYFRPLVQTDPARPPGAFVLAEGWCWFDRVEVLHRREPAQIIPAAELPTEALDRLCTARAPIAGLDWSAPRIMGVLNITPDSFSDGGLYHEVEAALEQAQEMARGGADILDIGGESTRPGAETVHQDEEIARVKPVISALSSDWHVPISIDTRKSAVANAAIAAGAGIINDISGFSYDPEILNVAAQSGASVCLMHSQNDPKVMQKNPSYADVLLDIYDFLDQRIAMAEAVGVPRHKVMVDPGIGFGKTLEHNLALLRRLSLFHSLGCPILVGLSRKSFIGKLAGIGDATARMPGSVAAAMHAVASGAQCLRVHDVSATRQALSVTMGLFGQAEDPR